MLRISPSMGPTLEVGLALRHLLFLLEYCMVTGYDWWDILLHVQPGMVQSLVERLHEEYTRQNAALQQVGCPGPLPTAHRRPRRVPVPRPLPSHPPAPSGPPWSRPTVLLGERRPARFPAACPLQPRGHTPWRKRPRDSPRPLAPRSCPPGSWP